MKLASWGLVTTYRLEASVHLFSRKTFIKSCVPVWSFTDITSVKWNVMCIGYESRLEKCKFRSQNYCYPRRRPPVGVVCSQKLLDKRVCREVRPRPCSSSVCFPQTSCVDGDGRVISKGSSFCMHCPKSYFGDGDNCTCKFVQYTVHYHSSVL